MTRARQVSLARFQWAERDKSRWPDSNGRSKTSLARPIPMGGSPSQDTLESSERDLSRSTHSILLLTLFSGLQFQKVSKRKHRVLVGGEMDEKVEEEIPADCIPQNFKAWVQGAIEKYNQKSSIEGVAVKTSEATWVNVEGDVYNYNINVGDVRKLDNVLEPKDYTLAVADIPYGFNAPGSEFDELPFSEQDVVKGIAISWEALSSCFSLSLIHI